MKVSIIVPCYKVDKFLSRCIESVLHQSYSDWELILVDDGSPDRSGEICDEYARKDSRIKVIHKENAGVAAARNVGIRIAKGIYTTYLDGDDFLHSDYILEMLRLVEEYNADIAQCWYKQGCDNFFPNDSSQEVIREYDSHQIFANEVDKVVVWGKLYKTEILKNILIPEGHYFEDDLVTWRWYFAAKKIVVTSKAYYYYTYNELSTMAQHRKKPNLSFVDAYDERITFFRNNKELDMEHYSHRQLCKALLLIYGNPMLALEQKSSILNRFNKSWKEIKNSPFITVKYKLVFGAFSFFPYFTAKVITLFR